MEFDNFSIEKLKEAYFYSNSVEDHFDYDKNILKNLLERDSEVIIDLLRFNTPSRLSHHEIELENFDFIWELDNHTEILDSIFDYFVSTDSYLFYERLIATFFPQGNKFENKPYNYLKDILAAKFSEEKYVEVLFSIICHKYPELKMEFVELFLHLNRDINLFMNLEIIPRTQSWSGSHIPILEGEKNTWEDVLSIIDRLPNRMDFLDHKEYVSRRIVACESLIKNEMRREFYDDFR
jgi:hypothetical protein